MRPIPDFPGYTITKTGATVFDKNGKPLTVIKSEAGTSSVSLCKEGKSYRRALSVLHAQAYNFDYLSEVYPIPDYPNYGYGPDGSIFSIRKANDKRRLKPTNNRVSVKDSLGKRKNILVYDLVRQAVFNGYNFGFIDGNNENYKQTNLQDIHGLKRDGRRSYCKKFRNYYKVCVVIADMKAIRSEFETLEQAQFFYYTTLKEHDKLTLPEKNILRKINQLTL
jgi:hypothetical protein